jgi:hypothetical protein
VVCGDNTKTIENTKTKKKKEIVHSKNGQERFETFWSLYPKKIAKKKAHDIWKRKKLDSQIDAIVNKLKEQIALDNQWQDVQFIPNPTTYLNGERWDDEIQKSTQPHKTPPMAYTETRPQPEEYKTQNIEQRRGHTRVSQESISQMLNKLCKGRTLALNA